MGYTEKMPCSHVVTDQSATGASGLSDDYSDKNDGLKWRIAEPFRLRENPLFRNRHFRILLFDLFLLLRYGDRILLKNPL
jgi:hypothetical protein